MRLKPRISWVPAPTAPPWGVPHPLPRPSPGALHSIFLLPSSFLVKDSHPYQGGLTAPQLSPLWPQEPKASTSYSAPILAGVHSSWSAGPAWSSPKPTPNHPHTLCKSGNARHGLSSLLNLSIHLWGPALTHPFQPTPTALFPGPPPLLSCTPPL